MRYRGPRKPIQLKGINVLNHDRVTREGQEVAALYALGALSQREACAFDVHIREGCSACAAELKQFDQVVGVMGSVAAPVAPPAYLRDLLAVRIGREAPDAPSASATVIPFPEQAGATELRSAPARSPFSGVWLPWAVAAALLIAFAYTFTAWQSERRPLQAAIEEGASAREENARLKEQLKKERSTSTELAQINSVLSSPQWRIIPLESQEPAPASSARIYWDVQGKRWVVTADLPPPPQGRVYQLWFVTPAAKISAGLINLHNDGHGFTVVQLPPNMNRLAAAAITLEPEGGSQQPTMPIYLLGKA
ncbi:MAG: anti-sigma factor [Acidobacteriota bacterium]